MTHLLPTYLPEPRAPHGCESSAVDPKGWSPGDWLEVGGAVAAAAVWVWRKTLCVWCRWICDWFKMPTRLREMESQLSMAGDYAAGAIARARATWDTLSDTPVWESDALGLCVHVSKPMLRILKRPVADIIGDNWRQMIYQPDRQMVYAEWDACIHAKRDFDLTYRWVTGEGDLLVIHANGNRIVSPKGEIIGWVSFVSVLQDQTSFNPDKPPTHPL